MTPVSTEVYKLVISLPTPHVMRINSVLKWFYLLVARARLGRHKSLDWKSLWPWAMEMNLCKVGRHTEKVNLSEISDTRYQDCREA